MHCVDVFYLSKSTPQPYHLGVAERRVSRAHEALRRTFFRWSRSKMRLIVSLAVCLCTAGVSLAGSPQSYFYRPVVVTHQAKTQNQATVAKQSTAASKQTPVSIMRQPGPVSKRPSVVVQQPVTAARPATRSQSGRRLIMQVSPQPPAQAEALAPVQATPRTFQRPGSSQFRMRIDSSRFPRFKSWTEM